MTMTMNLRVSKKKSPMGSIQLVQFLWFGSKLRMGSSLWFKFFELVNLRMVESFGLVLILCLVTLGFPCVSLLLLFNTPP